MSVKPKKLYVAVSDNAIVCYHVSMASFYKEFKSIEDGIKSQSYYEKQFKTKDVVPYINVNDRKTYYIHYITK